MSKWPETGGGVRKERGVMEEEKRVRKSNQKVWSQMVACMSGLWEETDWAEHHLSSTSESRLHKTHTHTFNLQLTQFLWFSGSCGLSNMADMLISLPDWGYRTERFRWSYSSVRCDLQPDLPPPRPADWPLSHQSNCDVFTVITWRRQLQLSRQAHRWTLISSVICLYVYDSLLHICWHCFLFYHSYHSRRRTASTTRLHQSSKVWKTEAAEVSLCRHPSISVHLNDGVSYKTGVSYSTHLGAADGRVWVRLCFTKVQLIQSPLSLLLTVLQNANSSSEHERFFSMNFLNLMCCCLT